MILLLQRNCKVNGDTQLVSKIIYCKNLQGSYSVDNSQNTKILLKGLSEMSVGLLIELAKLETCKVEFKKIAKQRVYKNKVFYSRLVIHISVS